MQSELERDFLEGGKEEKVWFRTWHEGMASRKSLSVKLGLDPTGGVEC